MGNDPLSEAFVDDRLGCRMQSERARTTGRFAGGRNSRGPGWPSLDWGWTSARSRLRSSWKLGSLRYSECQRVHARPFEDSCSVAASEWRERPCCHGRRRYRRTGRSTRCAGSIADCAGSPDRSEGRRRIERVLLQLGKEQIRSGKANQRTEMWVTAFSNWEKAGI
jgi:hypothetical protein